MPKKRRIRFVYRAGKESQGSTFLRCLQLCEMVRPFLKDDYDIDVLKIPEVVFPGQQFLWAARQNPNTVFIFSKAAINKLKPSTVDCLRRKGGRICLDHVDNDHRVKADLDADIQFCSSYAQLETLRSYRKENPAFKGKPMLLLHGYDLRLEGFVPKTLQDARMVYCGVRTNAFLTPEIVATMDILEISSSDDMQDAIPKLAGYNLHYCMRMPGRDTSLSPKPFTKGFTAAACGANVIAHRSGEDVEAFLGSDYPFLVDTDDPAEIALVIRRAKESFGTADWMRAQRTMQTVKERVSPKALAQQLAAALRELEKV